MTAPRRAAAAPDTWETRAGDLNYRDIGRQVSFTARDRRQITGRLVKITDLGPIYVLHTNDLPVQLTIADPDGWPHRDPYEVDPEAVVLVEQPAEASGR